MLLKLHLPQFFLKELNKYEEIDKNVSVAIRQFTNHLYYLAEECAAFAFSMKV